MGLVLYEDKSVGRQRFGLHELVLGCIADDKHAEPDGWHREIDALRTALEPRTLGGIGNVIRTLHGDVEELIREAGFVIALVDQDRLADHFAAEELRALEAARGGLLTIGILNRNLETLLEMLRNCRHHDPSVSIDRVALAIEKDRIARDSVLIAASIWGKQLLRRCIRDGVPSFDEFVKRAGAMADRSRLA